jgi:methionine synthase II (cobalamin-independent)
MRLNRQSEGGTMATSQEVETAVGAHLVGGLKAPDAESAMRTTAGILGRHLHALSDGETGDRSQWIWWQIGKLTAVEGIEMAGTHGIADSDNQDYSEFPALAVDASVTELPARSLGYADSAEGSYATFRRLREEGVVPDGVRFQVSIPTPYATVVAWVAEADQERFFPVYADAIAREVAEIARVVAPEDLAIQYDVAVEIGALTGNFPTGGALGEKRVVIEALRDILDRTPDGGERGVHLCYGDYKHRHFTVPEDLALCVELANAVSDAADFVHMPADRETGRDSAYFEPLRDLSARRLALGVIDYEGDEERTRELIAAAASGSGGLEFAVATECGMARIDERGPGAPSLERLLELHAATAAPIR